MFTKLGLLLDCFFSANERCTWFWQMEWNGEKRLKALVVILHSGETKKGLYL